MMSFKNRVRNKQKLLRNISKFVQYPLRVMETQGNITLRFLSTPGRMTKIKEIADDKCC